MEDVLYTVPEVAAILKTNVDYVYKLQKSGLVKFIKIGRLKCRRSTLLDFLAKYLKQEKQDAEIKAIKEEQRVMCKGVLACLDGLEQLGCNHSVPKAKEALENHINEVAHQ